MKTNIATLRLKAILTLPGNAGPDLSLVADPVRIPVRIVVPAGSDPANLAAPPAEQD